MHKDLRKAKITEDNLLELAEIITIRAVKTVVSHSNGKLDSFYRKLLVDVYKRGEKHLFADGYDLVQTTALFLWEHKGQYLGDYYGKNGKGKEYNLLYACYHVVNKHLSPLKRNTYLVESIHDKKYEAIPEQEHSEDDYEAFDRIVEQMHLTVGETDTLNCYMAGMTYCEIARFLGVNFSTIYRRKLSLQKKYLQTLFS